MFDRSKNEVIADLQDLDVYAIEHRALLLHLGLEHRLDVIEQRGQILRAAQFLEVRGERLRRVMATYRCKRLLAIGKTDFHEQSAQRRLFCKNPPQPIGRAGVTAIGNRTRFRLDDERGGLDRVCDEHGAYRATSDRQGFFRLELYVADRRVLRRRDDGEVGPEFVVEEVLVEDADGFPCASNEQRRSGHLATVVRKRREIADVIEMCVTDEASIELELFGELEATRESAGVDGKTFVEDERTRTMPRSFAAVTTNDAQVHVVSLPRPCCAAFRETRRSPEVARRRQRESRPPSQSQDAACANES